MDPGKEHEGQKGCCGSHSSDATVQRLATSKCGSETFLLSFVNKNIFVAPFDVTQYAEPTHTTTLTLYFEISMVDVSRSSRRSITTAPQAPCSRCHWHRALVILRFLDSKGGRTITIYRFPLRLDIIRKMSCVNLSIYFNSLGILYIFNRAAYMS